MNTPFESSRIDVWCMVRLRSGIVGVVTNISHTGQGSFYRVAAERLFSVPRSEIVQKLETVNLKNIGTQNEKTNG